MNRWTALPAGLLMASMALPAVGAGPSEINGIEGQMRVIEDAIAAAESQLKQALQGYGAGAGDQGVRLRRLRREHVALKQQLQAAVDAETERAATAAAVAADSLSRSDPSSVALPPASPLPNPSPAPVPPPSNPAPTSAVSQTRD
ncbi:MAG TPA: hypothetical protein VES73_05090 [Lamprocystis sp. (in: g-proteobacteria)]|nr:hypothetical protein [Lamprocystis sp. (in: g-proteobacteria)]